MRRSPSAVTDFDTAFAFLMVLEGGGTLHKLQGDPGGRTIWGISEEYHPDWWKNGPPTETQARQFYRRVFWEPLGLHTLREQSMAEELFEFAVNANKPPAVKAAQVAANVVRHCMGIGPIKVDGKMGPQTIGALNRVAEWGPLAVVAWDGAFNIEQLRHYRSLNKDLVNRFLASWARRVVL